MRIQLRSPARTGLALFPRQPLQAGSAAAPVQFALNAPSFRHECRESRGEKPLPALNAQSPGESQSKQRGGTKGKPEWFLQLIVPVCPCSIF